MTVTAWDLTALYPITVSPHNYVLPQQSFGYKIKGSMGDKTVGYQIYPADPGHWASKPSLLTGKSFK